MRYRKLQQIGRGSSGVCHLAEDQELGCLVVIKQVSLVEASRSQPQFGPKLLSALDEVRFLENVDHPNIIKYLDSFITETRNVTHIMMPRPSAQAISGEVSRTFYAEKVVHIVMEFASAGDLNEEICKRRSNQDNRQETHQLHPVFKSRRDHFDPIDMWLIFIQILLALKYVHGQRILHRDLKTRNIFLTDAGVVKLGDFGIAKQLNDEMAKSLVGSPHFMAPEIHKRQPYDEKSDIWSLGCILFQISTLQCPFEGDSLEIIHDKILSYQTNPAPTIDHWIQLLSGTNYPPPTQSELLVLYQTMLSVNPQKRPSISQILKLPNVRSAFSGVVQNFNSDDFPQFNHVVVFWHKYLAADPGTPINLKLSVCNSATPTTPTTFAPDEEYFDDQRVEERQSDAAPCSPEPIDAKVTVEQNSKGEEEDLITRRRQKSTVTTTIVKTTRRRRMSSSPAQEIELYPCQADLDSFYRERQEKMKYLVETERILICLLRMLNKPIEVKDESIPDTTTPKPTRRCPNESGGGGIAGGDSPIKCPPLCKPQPVEAVMIPPQMLTLPPRSLPRGMLSSRMTEAPRDIVGGIFLPKPSRSRTCVNTPESGKGNRFTPWKDKSNVKTSFDIEESVTEPSEASDLIDVPANTQRIPIPRLHLNHELHRSGFLTAPLAGVTRNSIRAAPVPQENSSPDTKMPADQAIVGLKPVSQTPEAQSLGLKTPAGPQRLVSRLSKARAPQTATNKDVERKISTSPQHQVLINSNSRNPAPPSVKQMSTGDPQVGRRISCSSRLVSSGAFSLSHQQQPSVQKSSAVGIRGFVAKSSGCLPPRFKASLPEPVAVHPGGTSPGGCFSPPSGSTTGRQIEPAAPKPAMSRAKADFRDRTMSFSPTGRMIPFTRSETTRTDNQPRATAARINQIPASRKVAARQWPPCMTRNSIGEPRNSEDARPTTGRETIGMYHRSSVMYGRGSVGNSAGKSQALYSGERNSFGFTCKRRAEAKSPTNAAQKTS